MHGACMCPCFLPGQKVCNCISVIYVSRSLGRPVTNPTVIMELIFAASCTHLAFLSSSCLKMSRRSLEGWRCCARFSNNICNLSLHGAMVYVCFCLQVCNTVCTSVGTSYIIIIRVHRHVAFTKMIYCDFLLFWWYRSNVPRWRRHRSDGQK